MIQCHICSWNGRRSNLWQKFLENKEPGGLLGTYDNRRHRSRISELSVAHWSCAGTHYKHHVDRFQVTNDPRTAMGVHCISSDFLLSIETFYFSRTLLLCRTKQHNSFPLHCFCSFIFSKPQRTRHFEFLARWFWDMSCHGYFAWEGGIERRYDSL